MLLYNVVTVFIYKFHMYKQMDEKQPKIWSLYQVLVHTCQIEQILGMLSQLEEETVLWIENYAEESHRRTDHHRRSIDEGWEVDRRSWLGKWLPFGFSTEEPHSIEDVPTTSFGMPSMPWVDWNPWASIVTKGRHIRLCAYEYVGVQCISFREFKSCFMHHIHVFKKVMSSVLLYE